MTMPEGQEVLVVKDIWKHDGAGYTKLSKDTRDAYVWSLMCQHAPQDRGFTIKEVVDNIMNGDEHHEYSGYPKNTIKQLVEELLRMVWRCHAIQEEALDSYRANGKLYYKFNHRIIME